MNSNSMLPRRAVKSYRVCPMGGERFAYIIEAPSIAHVVAWTRHYPAVIVKRVFPVRGGPWHNARLYERGPTPWPVGPLRHTWGFIDT